MNSINNINVNVEPDFTQKQKARIISRLDNIPAMMNFKMTRPMVFKLFRFTGEIDVKSNCIQISKNVYIMVGENKVYLSEFLGDRLSSGVISTGDQINNSVMDLIILAQNAQERRTQSMENEQRIQDKIAADKKRHAPLKLWYRYNSLKIEQRISKEAREEQLRIESKKSDWISLHGSDELKKAYGLGYPCKKRYYKEYAYMILGDEYIQDYDGVVDTKPMCCPTLPAMIELERNQSWDISSKKIVFLPKGISKLLTNLVKRQTEAVPMEAVEVRIKDLEGYWYRVFEEVIQ